MQFHTPCVLFCLLLVPVPGTSLLSYFVRPYHWFDALQTSAASGTIGHKLTLAAKLLGMVTRGAVTISSPQIAPFPPVYNLPVVPYYVPLASYPLGVVPLATDGRLASGSNPVHIPALSPSRFQPPASSGSAGWNTVHSAATPGLPAGPNQVSNGWNDRQNFTTITRLPTARATVSLVAAPAEGIPRSTLPPAANDTTRASETAITDTVPTMTPTMLPTLTGSDSMAGVTDMNQSTNEASSHLRFPTGATVDSDGQTATVNTSYGYQSLDQILDLEQQHRQNSQESRPTTTALLNERNAKSLADSQSTEGYFLDIYENDNLRCINKMICEMAADPSSFGSYGQHVTRFFANYVPRDQHSPSVGYKMAASMGSITRSPSACASRYRECVFDSHDLASLAADRAE